MTGSEGGGLGASGGVGLAWVASRPRERVSMARGGRGIGIHVLALGLLACGENEATPLPEPVVSDSAGIRIVDNGPVDLEEGLWRVSKDPIYRSGWGLDDPEFVGPSRAVLLPDGRAVVYDSRSPKLRLLSAQGELLHEFGREGRGPGELGTIQSLLHLGGDTLLVEDDRNIRFSVFHDGRLAREIGLASVIVSVRAHRGYGVTSSGNVLMAGGIALRAEENTWGRAHLVLMTSDGLVWDTVGSYESSPPRELGGNNVFAPRGAVAVSGGRFLTIRSDRSEVRWLDERAVLRQIARWESEPWPLTDRLRASIEPQLMELYGYENAPELLQAEIRANVGRTMTAARGPIPRHAGVVGDPSGNAWLPHAQPDAVFEGRIGRYHVVSADGRWIGVVDLPREARLLAIGEDRLLVVELNDYDVPAIVVYPLHKEELEG